MGIQEFKSAIVYFMAKVISYFPQDDIARTDDLFQRSAPGDITGQQPAWEHLVMVIRTEDECQWNLELWLPELKNVTGQFCASETSKK